MFNTIKGLIKGCRRRRILRDIKKAKRYFQEGRTRYMCNAFKIVSTNYFINPIDSLIPEFNREFLNAKYKKGSVWWNVYDRESRLEAFDKLIEVYSK